MMNDEQKRRPRVVFRSSFIVHRSSLGGIAMLDELKEEAIVNKVGGRFKLSTLIQKRMIMLNQGYKPLVDLPRSSDRMAVVIQEILQDKIYLDTSGQVQ